MIHIELTIQRRHLIILAGVLLAAVIVIPGVAWASNSFTDVPDTDWAHDDITWLADAGVTLGCGNGEFCPDAFVTRRQLAVFMHRLAENNVVDAATLDGLDSTEFAPSDLVGSTIMTVSSDPLGNPMFEGALNGPTGLSRVEGGHYVVTFDGRDVSTCAAATNNLIWASNFDVSADPTAGEPSEIVVKVRNSDDSLWANTYWSMIVVCPGGGDDPTTDPAP